MLDREAAAWHRWPRRRRICDLVAGDRPAGAERRCASTLARMPVSRTAAVSGLDQPKDNGPGRTCARRFGPRVARASEGERNKVAFWAACRAGEMAASGVLGDETAAAVIVHAAMLSGLPRAEAERTAWSGILTGRGSAPRA
jgi:hypothetical protein